jgi:rubrerythrin
VKDRVGKVRGVTEVSEVAHARRTKTYEMSKAGRCDESYDAVDSLWFCNKCNVSCKDSSQLNTPLHT